MFVCVGKPAQAQISPGPLSSAHQPLSGPTQCTTCHKLGAGSPTLKCLDCHTEIARRLAEQRGLHAALVNRNAPGQDCARCHSEHNGENFKLIRWDPTPSGFDHSKTGYALEGKHAGLSCKQCHAPERIMEADRSAIRMKDPRRTYLGLSRDCLRCHVDTHRGQLGKNCAQCHNFSTWKGVTQFDHSKARYPLTGLHAQVPCQKCHTTTEALEKVVKYRGIAFDKCTACHADPHRGAFAQSCQGCHTTSGWRKVQLAGKFDHSKTKFALLGKHANVRCSECHAGENFKRPLLFAQCADCHKPDPHGAQFAKRADGGACAGCHTVDGFKPARFGLKEHAATPYPLEDKHASVKCEKCHPPAGRATLYKIKHALCTDCHADPHQAQFASAPHRNRCESCHTLRGFRPSTFTLARHQQTRFPLGGGHVAVACIDCHKSTAVNQPATPAKYHFEDRACAACHADPHRGQFNSWMSKRRPDGAPAGCEACHTVKAWREITPFDHSTTNFPLLGAHRATECAACHKPSGAKRSQKDVVFRAAPTRCDGCHADVHGGQFAAKGQPPNCAACHNSIRWKPSLFDHETGSTFSLKGAHKNVPCALCHKLAREIGARKILFYKPTPRECIACHGKA